MHLQVSDINNATGLIVLKPGKNCHNPYHEHSTLYKDNSCSTIVNRIKISMNYKDNLIKSECFVLCQLESELTCCICLSGIKFDIYNERFLSIIDLKKYASMQN